MAPYAPGAVCVRVCEALSRGPTVGCTVGCANLKELLISVLVASALADAAVRGAAAVVGLRANQPLGAIVEAALGLLAKAGDV